MLDTVSNLGIAILLAAVAALVIDKLRSKKRSTVTLRIDIKE